MFRDIFNRRGHKRPAPVPSGQPVRPRKRPVYLHVEVLEDRIALARITVTTFKDELKPDEFDHTRSLREALAKANANPDPDTIVLKKGGVYTMEPPSCKGEAYCPRPGGRFGISNPVTIEGHGATVDAGGLDGVFGVTGPGDASSPIQVTFKDLTILNGWSLNSGGGILVMGSVDLKLVNCALNYNTAEDGAGIWSLGGASITLLGSTVSHNISEFGGGGIKFSDGQVTLERSEVLDNSAGFSNTAGGDGGGILGTGTGTLKLTDSKVANNKSKGSGGGLAFKGGLVTLTRSKVLHNHAELRGGGIFAAGSGELYLLDRSEVSHNTSSTDGGGIASEGGGDVFVVEKSFIFDNKAEGRGGGLYTPETGGDLFFKDSVVSRNKGFKGGGGIYHEDVASTVTLEFTLVAGNRSFDAEEGGGGIVSYGRLTLTDVQVNRNISLGPGAGIRAMGAGVVIERSSLIRNIGGYGKGGGLALEAWGNSSLTNVTVSGNQAPGGGGGGIFQGGSGTLTLLNVTIASNTARFGGGIYKSGGPVVVTNTIIAQNFGFNPDVSGGFASGGHNLIGAGDGSVGFFNGVNGDQVGSAVARIDPMLAPVYTEFHALRPGSPAIDAADDAAAPATDQRLVPRPRDGDADHIAIADIGAFEL